jgi:hypothetical protein
VTPIALEASLASGERLWWDECSPDWIAGVAGTGTPYTPGWSRAGSPRCPTWPTGWPPVA